MNSNLKFHLKRGSPMILTILGAVGVIATTIAAVKATPKALEKIKADSQKKHEGDLNGYTKAEAVKSSWRFYIPTAIFGISTLVCIFGANALNKKQQAALTSAYMLLNNTYKEFAKNDEDGDVRKDVVKNKAESIDISPNKDYYLFYEFNYGEFFERSLEDVLSAEYLFNQKFISTGYANLNDFYEFIGLPKSKIGETLGWRNDDGYPWIDFEHELVELEDGMECYAIYLPDEPIPNYLESRKIHTTLWKGGKGSW